jgi:small subunit ribosomal protein S13
VARRSKNSLSFLQFFQTYYGLGQAKACSTAARFLLPVGFSANSLARLSSDRFESYLYRFYLFGKLAQRIPLLNIRSKIVIGSRTGLRFKAGLPVRGQRTRTNASTANAFFSSRHYFLKSKF